jgi:hypothetical protein
MHAPEKQMSLPARQQKILDQIEQVLQAADPRLKSMFASFARMAPAEAAPATEAISGRSVRRTVMVSVLVLSMLGVITFNVFTAGKDCPGLSSDQVVASAAVRYAACSHATNAWSKGAR